MPGAPTNSSGGSTRTPATWRHVALINHEALLAGDPFGAAARFGDDDDTVLRTWMLTQKEYAGLASAAAGRGAVLRTSPDAYGRAHHLPGWARALGPFTAETSWTSSDDLEEFKHACTMLGEGPVVIRDYVKSAKHAWNEAAYIPEVADLQAATAVAGQLRQIRGAVFTGGFVLRRFEEYRPGEMPRGGSTDDVP